MGKPDPAVAVSEPPAASRSSLAGALPPLARPDARVGLFGGTFDPVHLGHLAVARAARAALDLDHLFFIPAAHAPLRDGPPAASAADRLDFLRLALAESAEPRFGLLDLETRAGGINYTVDTVRHLHAAWPCARLFWILGADQLAQLDRWREPAELSRLVEFAVLPRPASASSETPAPPPSLAPALRWQLLPGAAHPARASEIRRRLHAGEPWAFWLPRSVAAAIEERHLYR